MMDKEWKALWLKALRSKKYKQGHHRLRNNEEGYCCLGVLCDLVDPKKWMKPRKSTAFYTYGRTTYAMPSRAVLKTVGLTLDEVSIYANMNDDGASFARIATAIDKRL